MDTGTWFAARELLPKTMMEGTAARGCRHHQSPAVDPSAARRHGARDPKTMATWTRTWEVHVAQRQGGTKVVWWTARRRWPLRPRAMHAPTEDSQANCPDRKDSLALWTMENRTEQKERQTTQAPGVHAAQWARRLQAPRCRTHPDLALRSPCARWPLGAAAQWGQAVLLPREAEPKIPADPVAPARTSDSEKTKAAQKAGRTAGASHLSRRTTWVRSRAGHLFPRTAWHAQAVRPDAEAP